MGAKLQDWFDRNIWQTSKRGYENGLSTINGSILESILSSGEFTDETVTPRGSLKITPVFISVNVRGNTMASLPMNVIREEGGKKQVLTDHPAYYPLSQEPNKYMTAPNFWKTIMLHIDLWGNGYARINRDSRNRPVSFDIWEPWCVTKEIVEGDLFYKYEGETESSDNVLHFRFLSLDGVCGLSPVTENINTLGMAKKLQRYSSLILGAQPPGVLSYEGNLSAPQQEQNREAWKAGPKGEVKVLSGKWNYQPIISEADATQFIQTKEANEREIFGIWQMPPTFAQNFIRATYSNAEQGDLSYAKHTITPIATNIEKECNMKLFFNREKENTYTKFNLNGLLRGDMAARQSFYQSMINSGVMLRNEARSLEDLNEYDGGEVPLIQGAMIPADTEGIDALRKKMETEVIPSAGKPVNGKHLNGHGVLN